ncbi:hypothetical protein SAMN05192588_2342 [Nonlabens sp. Hel1_33_55]|uniref:hypothetical protein n=1 Tax=Nonlabens sp. Hel1_33_55 TaxID=1336802 RepID=UPI000875C0EB|nr:hypothetical protein [Nonlabens sp. Hel1_33_55]SCY33734.1 hypothetical protein SAMN05192588_2342 [Nonlabens sp. Hel1_33_55]
MRTAKVIFLILICFSSCKEVEQAETYQADIEILKEQVDSLKLISEKAQSNYWFDYEFDGNKLVKNGISNPEGFIENSLRKNEELIPINAALGGKMGFGNIQVLSSEWLIAEFDDGHILGKAIYKFSLNNNNQLDFELLDYQVPE